jgi:hypothetical protein
VVYLPLRGSSSIGHARVVVGYIALLHPSVWYLRGRKNISAECCFDTSVHTIGKYRSIAVTNRWRYCLGVIIVGSPFAAPRNAESLTQLSSFLSHVYVRW